LDVFYCFLENSALFDVFGVSEMAFVRHLVSKYRGKHFWVFTIPCLSLF